VFELVPGPNDDRDERIKSLQNFENEIAEIPVFFIPINITFQDEQEIHIAVVPGFVARLGTEEMKTHQAIAIISIQVGSHMVEKRGDFL
jgi:hypothetical protein